MQIITTAVIKGGTGKSTTTAALAQAATASGYSALIIDLDPQANVSFFIGANLASPGSYQLLTGEYALNLIQNTAQNIDIIPASPDLATIKTSSGSAKRLKTALEPIKAKYDFIFIDTPPQMGELTFNALQASTGLIVPLETDNSSLQGLYQITDIAYKMRQTNHALSFMGAVLTRYDSRPKINRYLYNAIHEQAQKIGVPLLGTIRPGVAIREAQAMQQSIYEYAPKSKPAQDYKKLFERILEE